MSYTPDTGFFSSEYETTDSFNVPLGLIDSRCIVNQDCQTGLMCQSDSGGWKSCQVNTQNTDTRKDTRKNEGNGAYKRNLFNQASCVDSKCAPRSLDPPAIVDNVKCSRAQIYQANGVNFCGVLTQQTGQFEQLPERCCITSAKSVWNLEPDYIEFSINPQYYGV